MLARSLHFSVPHKSLDHNIALFFIIHKGSDWYSVLVDTPGLGIEMTAIVLT